MIVISITVSRSESNELFVATTVCQLETKRKVRKVCDEVRKTEGTRKKEFCALNDSC